MFGTYRAVFRAPGSLAFAAAGFVMRMPIAIYPLGLVLVVSARTGHYGFAGVLSACYVVGGVPGGPLLSRLVDRHGQRRLLVPATAVHVAAVVALAVLLEIRAPDWTLVAPTLLAGFAYLSVGSLIRARWSLVLSGQPTMATAYSLESILDEMIFVIGPIIATLIATHTDPTIVFYVAIVLVAGGALWLSSQHATEPPAHPAGAPAHASALRSRGMVLLTVCAIGMGAVFASVEITMVAFCGQHGHRGLSGLVVSMFALGSGVSGVVYGSRSWRSDVLTRFRLQALIFGVLPIVFLAATNTAVLAVCAFVAGLGIAPTLITAFSLIEQLVAGTSLVEGLTWLLTGLNIGYGAGSAVVGGIADAHGARVAFGVSIVSGLATAVVALVLHRRLTAASASPPPGRTEVGSSEHAALP